MKQYLLVEKMDYNCLIFNPNGLMSPTHSYQCHPTAPHLIFTSQMYTSYSTLLIVYFHGSKT